jgi:hypothetical protein
MKYSTTVSVRLYGSNIIQKVLYSTYDRERTVVPSYRSAYYDFTVPGTVPVSGYPGTVPGYDSATV